MLKPEPLTDVNLDEVVAYFHAANPFAQEMWGWDSGRFVDWRWGGNTRHLLDDSEWFSKHCWLFRDGGEIGAVLVAEYGEEEMCIVTPGEDPGAIRSVLDWLVSIDPSRVCFEITDSASWLAALFHDRGFEESPHTGHEWAYALSSVPEPVVASGFALASLADGPAMSRDGISDCLRAAFGIDRDLVPTLLSLEGNPMFDPDLSVFALDPVGRIAAYCRGTVNPTTGVASIDPVATHPDFHRMGLAKAIVRECFRRQAERGGSTCYIGSAAEPAESTHLYRSLDPIRRSDNSIWATPS